MPSYVEKRAIPVQTTGPSDDDGNSIEMPKSGSLTKYAEKKDKLINRGSITGNSGKKPNI